MTNHQQSQQQRDYDLRAAAERELAKRPQTGATQATEKLLHELQVHQIELEMQNDELRTAQAALEASRDRYVDLYDFAPVGYLTLTADGLIAETNLTGAMLLGVERANLLHKSFVSMVAPEDRSRWGAFFLSMKELDRKVSAELVVKQGAELVLKQGAGNYFHARIDSMAGMSDGVPVWRITLADITDLKKFETSLKERELELSVIIETEPECVLQLAEDGCLLKMNRAGLKMIEADSLDQVAGKSLLEIVAPAFREVFKSHVQDAFHGTPGVLEFKIIGLKGAHRWLESHAVPLHDSRDTIISLLSITRDITERKRMEKQLRQLAFYDPLTNLPNRRLLNDRLSEAMVASERSGRFGALVFLDLDDLKRVNDSRGHAVGDLLLIETAERLRRCVREIDSVARFGGDEFVVMLRELSLDKTESNAQAEIVAEKIRSTLAEPYWLAVERDGMPDSIVELHCTASIGVVMFFSHEASQDDIVKSADMAMYQAKQAGRNSIRFFDPVA